MCPSLISNTKERDSLKLRAFYLRLAIAGAVSAAGARHLPETLTLVYLPRINGNLLEINDAKIRSDVPAFVALHRVRSAEQGRCSEAVFASTDWVRVSEGMRFEVYVGEEKMVKGVFRRDEGGDWRMECRCAVEIDPAMVGVTEVELCVAGERRVLMREKVEMVVKRRRRRRGFCLKLEEIPEESDGCDCCCCGGGEEEQWEVVGSDGGDGEEEEGLEGEDGVEVEGVGWAVDLGIWVMCLGVGFLVSKASYKGLRKKRFI